MLQTTPPADASTVVLRQYQIDGVRWLVSKKRALLADEPRLGKSAQSVIAMQELKVKHCLIVCQAFNIGVWQSEVKRWTGQDAIVFGSLSSVVGWKFCIISYGKLDKLQSLLWDGLIVDESHNIRNRDTLRFKNLKKIRSTYCFLLSGSPVLKSVMDLWPQLHLIDNRAFSSYWAFARKNCYVSKSDYGMEVYGLQNPKGFREFLSGYMLRRLMYQVMPELPPKHRSVIPVEMGSYQREHYDAIQDAMMTEFEDSGRVMTPIALAQLTRLRQLLVTPALIGGINDSQVFASLKEHIENDLLARLDVVVFCPFPAAFELMPKFTNTFYLRGGMRPEDFADVIFKFKNCFESAVIYCSLQTATGFSLTPASVAYFVGYDWTPAINFQAEDRLMGHDQTRSVECRYFVHYGTVDEHVMDILDGKTTITQLAIQPSLFMKEEV